MPERAAMNPYDWIAGHAARTSDKRAIRFGEVAGYDGRALPAPELPLGRLKPRDAPPAP